MGAQSAHAFQNGAQPDSTTVWSSAFTRFCGQTAPDRLKAELQTVCHDSLGGTSGCALQNVPGYFGIAPRVYLPMIKISCAVMLFMKPGLNALARRMVEPVRGIGFS